MDGHNKWRVYVKPSQVDSVNSMETGTVTQEEKWKPIYQTEALEKRYLVCNFQNGSSKEKYSNICRKFAFLTVNLLCFCAFTHQIAILKSFSLIHSPPFSVKYFCSKLGKKRHFCFRDYDMFKCIAFQFT